MRLHSVNAIASFVCPEGDAAAGWHHIVAARRTGTGRESLGALNLQQGDPGMTWILPRRRGGSKYDNLRRCTRLPYLGHECGSMYASSEPHE